eukprot:6176042-Amphidinium_carterae.1
MVRDDRRLWHCEGLSRLINIMFDVVFKLFIGTTLIFLAFSSSSAESASMKTMLMEFPCLFENIAP